MINNAKTALNVFKSVKQINNEPINSQPENKVESTPIKTQNSTIESKITTDEKKNIIINGDLNASNKNLSSRIL